MELGRWQLETVSCCGPARLKDNHDRVE